MEQSSDQISGNPEGGNGGSPEQPPATVATATRSDLQMIRQAVSNGWDLPPELMKALPQVLINQIADEGASRREKRLAIDTLRKMQTDNLAAAKLMAQMEGDIPPDEGAPVSLTVLIQQSLQGMHATGEVKAAVRKRLADVLGDGR